VMCLMISSSASLTSRKRGLALSHFAFSDLSMAPRLT
jgi:hypothetical protein